MTLKEQAKTALANHANQAGPHRLDLDDGSDRLTAELLSLDTLGCEFSHLTLHTPKLAGAPADRLQGLARSLSQRLTYLLEPIALIETDAEGCTGSGCIVQMRSNPPQRDDDGASYYELLVRRGGELDLRRWRKAPGGTRTPLAATVTQEVFLRLVGDLAEAAK